MNSKHYPELATDSDLMQKRTRDSIGKQVKVLATGQQGTIVDGRFAIGEWVVKFSDGTEREYKGPELIETSEG